MNAKKFSDAMSELDTKYIDEALSYDKSRISKVRPRKLGILIAAVIAVLALCGFAAYELGLFDPWFQKPSTDPVQTVQSAIEGQAGKEYTISVRVDEIKVECTPAATLQKKEDGRTNTLQSILLWYGRNTM